MDFEGNIDNLYDKSDFKGRKQAAFAKKKLKDDRPSKTFKINSNGTYVNDPEQKLYEIYKGEDNKKYLVFVLSIFKVSLAYDDELMMREVDIGLSISPETNSGSLLSHN